MRVSAVEYLLVGAGLVLFFVLLLAFAEVIGFTPAYLVAAVAIIGAARRPIPPRCSGAGGAAG